MKTWVTIARIFLGVIYLVFGLDYFFQFIPYKAEHTAIPAALIAGMKGTGYIYPYMKVIQILGGLSMIFNRYAPFSAVMLFPISLNVLLFHTILVPSGWFMGVALIVPNVFLGWAYRKYYQGIFIAKPVI